MSSNDQNSPPLPSPNATDRRRSSFSAAGLADLFNRQANNGTNNSTQNSVPPAYPGPITTAAAQAQRRRLSLTTLGLSGAPNTAPFKPRTESFSSTSSNSNTVDESPFEEGESAPPPSASSPFARRLSFGARALGQRQSNGAAGNANGRSSIDNKASAYTPTNKGRGLSTHSPTFLPLLEKNEHESVSPPSSPPPSASSRYPESHNSSFQRRLTFGSSAAGEGFNFADSMRNRAERTSSISGPGMSQSPPGRQHERAKSVAVIEPPKAMPKAAAAAPKVPDAVQERMLRGDFYMD